MAWFGLPIPGRSPRKTRQGFDLRTLAIIVNYKSVSLTLDAVRSVMNSESLGPVAVAVVDNSESLEEVEKLQRGLPASVDLMVNAKNVGFGRACNRAAEPWLGDAILLINPDAKLLPGCLKRLQQTLFSCKAAAAVSPQIFWDEALEYYFPPAYSPGLMEFQSYLADRAFFTRFMDLICRRYAVRAWRSRMPFRVGNLSGGLVLLKFACIQKAGGFFDPRFFLYFEDTDLFFRLRQAGFDLLMEPRARAIHYYDQCGIMDLEKKRQLMHTSMVLFQEKYGRVWKSGLARIVSHLMPSVLNHDTATYHRCFSEPFSLEIPSGLHKEWLFEWSPNFHFTPSAGRFGTGGQLEFSEPCWKLLSKGQYYGRIGSAKRLAQQFLNMTWVVE